MLDMMDDDIVMSPPSVRPASFPLTFDVLHSAVRYVFDILSRGDVKLLYIYGHILRLLI